MTQLSIGAPSMKLLSCIALLELFAYFSVPFGDNGRQYYGW